MATLTCGRGFFMGFLICMDLIHSGVLHSIGLQRVGHNWATELNIQWAGQTFQVFFGTLQSDYSLSLDIVFLKGGPVLNSCLMICARTWLEGRDHLQSHRPCEYEEPSSIRFKVVFLEDGSKETTLLPAPFWSSVIEVHGKLCSLIVS